MNNASFHYGGRIKEIARIYLPPYSPEFNIIELFWAVLKQKVRLQINSFSSLFVCIKDCVV